ncbi:GNAT family N-acetyltransferase [Hamadaea tsunoensis]|uniref:GNAT family N-acetyltransferase n=1 Tax=Hamadaea tsunoensis TaxID=53368 RepID=UPI00040D79DB|nr:GNAT family N-acetyltransferase [Hamadaea tsunoensis]
MQDSLDGFVQNSVIAQLRQRPRVVETGSFVLGWDPSSDSRFISYATPTSAAATAADVAALVAEFRAVDRVPRLEYVVSAAPGLEGQLLAAGFTVEARHDYLVCTPDSLVVPAAPDGCTIAAPASDAEIAAAVAAQNEAFGGEYASTEADVARVRRNLDKGAVFVVARLDSGEFAGAGQAGSPSAGASEVAGIAVRPAYRRRGIAGALTAEVTRQAFAGGVEIGWLEASGEDSWRVYERVGFAATGKRLYIALD